MKKQTSDTQSVVRYEARKWREATTGTHEERQDDYTFKDVSIEYPAEWGVYDIQSGVRLDYSKDEAEAKATADKWNANGATAKATAKAESAQYLKPILSPGDEVKTILRSCSRSGMSRRVSLVIAKDGDVLDITWHASRVLGENQQQGGQYVQDAGIVMGGCGMDMGFALVYNLSGALYPDGFPVADGIAPNGHKMMTGNFRGSHAKPLTAQDMAEYVRKGWKFRGRNGDASGWDTDGGYALKQRWL